MAANFLLRPDWMGKCYSVGGSIRAREQDWLFAAIGASVLSILAASPAAADTLTTRADALVRTGSTIVDRQTDTTSPGGSVSALASGTNGVGQAYSGSASALVDASDYGELRIAGSAGMTGSGQASALSQIDIRDTITFSDGTLTGQLGLWHVSILVDGSLASTNNATSSVQSSWGLVYATVTGSTYASVFNQSARSTDGGSASTQQCVINGVANNVDYTVCNGLFAIDVAFTFGTPFDLIIGFDGAAASITNAIGHAGNSGYDLANSVYWGGTSRVTVGGVTVSNYQFGSDSGFDWRASSIPDGGSGVPEPATLALLGLGLAGLGFSRRKQ